jgi:hypothetical protein
VDESLKKQCVRPLAFPRTVENRPGLSRINYGVGVYSEFFEHLKRRLNERPELAGWTHREPDDPGIALLEGAAVLGDILSFYQELYANEAFLRTAEWRSSIAELVRLSGYRLAPGLGGRGTFALEVRDGDPITVPEGLGLQLDLVGSDQPVTFETLSDSIAYPELSRFRLYGPLHQPYLYTGQSELWLRGGTGFEAGDRLFVAREGASNSSQLTQTQIVVVEEVRELHDEIILKIEGSLQLSGPHRQLTAYRLGRSFGHFGRNAPEQKVSLSDGTADATDVGFSRSLTETTTEHVSRPLSHLQWPLDASVDDLSIGSLVICTYDAGPSWYLSPKVLELQGQISAVPLIALDKENEFNRFLSSPSNSDARIPREIISTTYDTPIVYMAEVDLPVSPTSRRRAIVDRVTPSPDRFAPRIPTKSPSCTVVRKIRGVQNTSLSWGGLSGASTQLTVEKGFAVPLATKTDIRSVELHEVKGDKLEVRAQPVSSSRKRGKTLYFFGSAAAAHALDGRRVLLSKAEEEPIVSRAAVVPNRPPISQMGNLHKVVLDVDVNYADFPQSPEENEGVEVFGNLVDANEGKTEREVVLGNGDGRRSFQTFEIPKSPLTYHYDTRESPPQVPQLEVWVSGRRWKRVDSLHSQDPDAEVYVVRQDDQGTSWVQFGDGKMFGSRLPSGVGNVKAKFRSGVGAHGPLKPETNVQPTGRVERLDKVVFPGVVSGGQQPEQQDVAREAAPGRVQSLGRIVSLGDFESEALAIAGVAKASASWDLNKGIPAVIVTVLMETGRESEFSTVEASLKRAAEHRGPDRFEIMVVEGSFLYVYLAARFALKPGFSESAVMAEVEKALGVEKEGGRIASVNGLFSLRRRRFGHSEHRSKVVGVVQNVEGVAWSEVTGFQALGGSSGPSSLSIPPNPVNRATVACPNRRVLKLFDRIDSSPLQLSVVHSGDGGGGA